MRVITNLILAVFLVTASTTQAGTVTFDLGPAGLVNDLGHYSYTEAGIRVDFYGDAPEFINRGSGNLALGIHLNNLIYFSRAGGGTFDAISMLFLGGGDTSFGGLHLIGLQNFIVFPPTGWTSLTDILWCGYCISGFNPNNAIDDFTVAFAASSAVPEPTSVALFGIALAAVGISRRRKKT